ncbi:hypothetical protein Tco_0138620 [Tanacetum coccineum]
MTHPHPNRRFVPQAVLTRSGKINTAGASVNTAVRPVNTAGSKTTMNHPRPISNAYKKGYSQVTKPFNKYSANKNSIFNKKVNTVRVKDTTARDRAVVSENKGKGANAGNPQQKEYKEKGVIDSGCSRHMTGNKCYLTEYEDYDGGFVSFGDGKERAIGTKWVFRNKKDERGIVVRNKARLVAQGVTSHSTPTVSKPDEQLGRRTARISVLPIKPNLAERARISAINLDDYQLDPVTPPPSPSSLFSMAAYQRMIAETDPTRREEALTAYGTETGQGSMPVPKTVLTELEAFLILWDVKPRVEESLLETLSVDKLITQLRQWVWDALDRASNAQGGEVSTKKEGGYRGMCGTREST